MTVQQHVPEPTVCSSCNGFVTGISAQVTATELKSIFSNYGKVVSAKILASYTNPSGPHYGLVTMSSVNKALTCVKSLNNTMQFGDKIFLKCVGEFNIGARIKHENKVHSIAESSGLDAGPGKGSHTRGDAATICKYWIPQCTKERRRSRPRGSCIAKATLVNVKASTAVNRSQGQPLSEQPLTLKLM